MTSKSNHNRLLSTIRDVVQASTPEENIDFICNTLITFEKSFGAKNRDVCRKMINETMSTYGPGTRFESDERVIPIYVLLGKYSRSSSVLEIFDKLNASGAYRNSALFYLEWSTAHQELAANTKAKDILEDGIRRRAKPLSILEDALRKLSMTPPVRTSNGSSISRTVLGTHAPRSARKALFAPEKPEPKPSASIDEEFVLPALPQDVVPPVTNRPAYEESPYALPPTEFVCPTPSPHVFAEPRPVPHEDAENLRPPTDTAVDDSVPKRRISGILVPAVGFQLEDYDFYKKDDEIEEEAKAAEQLKAEQNQKNILNNRPKTADAPIVSVPSSSNEFVLPPLTPLQPNPLGGLPSLPESDEFMPASQALANLRPDSDEDEAENDRRLTGFEMRMNQKRKSLAKQRLSVAKTMVLTKKAAEFDMDTAFSRMGLNSPGPSNQ